MKKPMCKLTVRLPEGDISAIEKYPGKNISEKMRSLLAMHEVLVNELEGADLKEKYELLLKGYLAEYDFLLDVEIEERRKELRRYMHTLNHINVLDQSMKELQDKVAELCKMSSESLEQEVANCVMVRKKAGKEL